MFHDQGIFINGLLFLIVSFRDF
uniref:Uncharacterized protein n=1 Tax=Heterorhabditis bacteriophora TaxID=37862 RepID=A0A1I7WVY5_HETBA